MNDEGSHTGKRRFYRNSSVILLLKATGITGCAYVLSLFLVSPFTASISTLFSSSDKSDFCMKDLYMQVANNRPIRNVEDNFVILDIGRCNREEIAELLSTLSLCSPRLVAVDVNFEQAGDNDSILIASLLSLPKLILPLGVASRGDKFTISDRPFFYDSLPNIEYGIINFPSNGKGGTIREYAIDFPMMTGEKLPSLAMAIADEVYPEESRCVRERGESTEIISYHSKEIKIIPYDELIERAEEFTDKIVLVGTTSEASDLYSIPLQKGVSGVQIHGYALSTILHGEYLREMPKTIDTVIAIILCFLMVLGAAGIRGGIRGLVIRIAQLAALYFLVRMGYGLLVDRSTVADFSQSILMITFGLLVVDVWNGVDALIGMILKFIKKKKTKKI